MNQKDKEIYDFDEIEKKLKSLPEKDLPVDFHSNLMSKIYKSKEEEKMKWWDSILKMLRPREISIVAAVLLLTIVVIAQTAGVIGVNNKNQSEMMLGQSLSNYDSTVSGGMSNSFSGDMFANSTAVSEEAPQAAMRSEKKMDLDSVMNQKVVNPEDNLKIIKTANITLETLDFDGVLQTIRNLSKNSGGYVENSSSYIYESHPDKGEYLKKGNIKVRIPKEQYESIKTEVGNIGKVISTSEGTENVTENYVEIESKTKTLEIQQERLLDIMKKATKVEELIQLEARLSEIRSQLESYKSQMKNWDKLVAYSTIYVDLTQVRNLEIVQPVDKNLMQRIGESFSSSINNIRMTTEDLAVWFAGNIIIIIINIIIYGALIIIVIMGTKKVIKMIKK
ncbi:MAG TPA: hypothetical protein DEP72_03965 [Clostridiales bacterium]|nr:MAG: hypothetical protein A2Y18_04240 [Clostridiales bacterium GWD2_32_19]HCC07303.1 hypothetical protein [Clostridiales bacterium]